LKRLVCLDFFDILERRAIIYSQCRGVWQYALTITGRKIMKIELEGSLLKMTPENDREKTELNQLWTLIIDCAKDNRKLVPVGQYLPGTKEVATFNIE
jgi:hypothetical protein